MIETLVFFDIETFNIHEKAFKREADSIKLFQRCLSELKALGKD